MSTRLLLPASLLLLVAFTAFAQQEDSTMSWLATGPATATYAPDSNYVLSLTGTHSEITLWQDRSVFTNFFDGLHLISLDLSGEGTDGSGNLHAPKIFQFKFVLFIGL